MGNSPEQIERHHPTIYEGMIAFSTLRIGIRVFRHDFMGFAAALGCSKDQK
jgi:hypothetical protein